MPTNALAPPSQKHKLAQPGHAKSSTSLVGLEQAIAPHTQPAKKPSIVANHWKPLPPPPSTMTSQGSITQEQRRSSSVYSDVLSAWYASTQVSGSIQPSRSAFYEANRSNPRASMSEPQLLLPRTYQPLLDSPSVIDTPETSPVIPPLVHKSSELLPPPDHLHTISLAKAQAMVDAPGSRHYLPEELRAQNLARSRSSEHFAELSAQDMSKPSKPGSAFKPHESQAIRLPSLMMLDAQTWHTFDPSKHKPSRSDGAMTTQSPKGQSQGEQTSAAYLGKSRQTPRKPSYEKYTAEELRRGRTRAGSLSDTKGRPEPRKPSYEMYTAEEFHRGRTKHRVSRKAGPPRGHNAEELAAEYSAVLGMPDSDSNLTLNAGHTPYLVSDAKSPLQEHPKTLSARKPLLNASGRIRPHSPQSSVSPKQVVRIPQSAVPSIITEDSRPHSPPPRMFVFNDSDDDHFDLSNDSRIGSIPISPPSHTDLSRPNQLGQPIALDASRPPLPPSPTTTSPPPPDVVAALAQFQAETQMDAKAKRKARESAYYPYVGRRRYGKHDKKPPAQQANAAVRIPHTARSTSMSSSSKSGRSRKHNDVPELVSRAVKKASHITDRLGAKPDHIRGPVSPNSPHLYPTSPPNLNQSVTGVYLGWSEESKDGFDSSKPVSPRHHCAAKTFSPNPGIKPMYEHVVGPARPLDERAPGSDPPTRGRMSRSGSIFSTLLELRKEKGRERRREEIKKTIRIVPNATGSPTTMGDPVRPGVVERSASDAALPSERPQEQQPRLALWGRRISEFGMI